jgi:hypothetical protein
MIFGPKAKGVDLQALSKAETLNARDQYNAIMGKGGISAAEMEAQKEAIRQETGWFTLPGPGFNPQWRTEVSDLDSKN